MSFKFYQPNDKQELSYDCVIRALSKAFNKSWLEVFDELVKIARTLQVVLNEDKCFNEYLKDYPLKKIKKSKPTIKEKDITVNIMNKKTKLKNFLKQVSGNFIVRDSRGGYAVYTSKTEGPNNLSFYSNMTVTDSYPDKDEDGDAVLVIVIDSWDN